MRTITKNVYKIDELPNEIVNKIVESYQENPYLADHVSDEGLESIETFVKHFDLEIKEYQFNPLGRCFVAINYDHSNFRGLKLKNFDPDYMPTGYAVDINLWETFYNEFKETTNAMKAFQSAIESAVHQIECDMEEQYSRQAIIEFIEINEFEFYEDGTIYCD